MDDSLYDEFGNYNIEPEIESERESDAEIGYEELQDNQSEEDGSYGEHGAAELSIPNSEKQFKSLHLKNGLTALIVSDPNDCPAAAAMNVGVGSFSDPREAQGLAHLIEHMLSRGSKRFPKENDFENYISMHGGNFNAGTSNDCTKYYWQVDQPYLEGALERFSQFFITPLFDPDTMDQQICTIDSEFVLSKQKDLYRLEQLKHHTSKNDHSFNRFTHGNKDSLRTDEGMDALRKRAQNFFDNHYYGASLKLCVIGGESLSELEKWVNKYFGDVKESPKAIYAKLKPKPVWDASTLYVLDSVQGDHMINIYWMLPPSSDSLEKPEIYLIKLLRNERKDSLYAFLKDKRWVFDKLVDIEDELKQYKAEYRLFRFSLSLTDLGLQKKYDLITYIYKYIKSLRNMEPQQWFWEEYWKTKKIEFECLDIDGIAIDSCDFAQYLSGNMQKYPIKHVLSAEYMQNSWNPDSIIDLMKELTPRNMRIDIISNSLQAEGIKTEPWFQMHYKEEQIPPELIEEWSEISEIDQAEFLSFPSKNPFIPNSFIPRVLGSDQSNDEPTCIINKQNIKMWFQCNEGSSNVFIGINLNRSYNFKEEVMMNLLVMLLTDELEDIIFQGEEANLCTSLSMSEDKLVFKIEGYRENIRLFISDLWKRFICFSPRLERFKIIKQEAARDYRNMDIEDKSNLLMHSMLYKECNGLGKTLNALKQVSFVHFQNFIGVVCSKISIEGFCYGDFLEEEVHEISNIFETTSELSGAKLRRGRNVLCVPQEAELNVYNRFKLRRDAKVNSKTDSNSIAKVYFLIGRYKDITKKESALLTLFNTIVQEKVFHQLRTQEKLGYVVNCDKDITKGVWGFQIYVISSTYNPNHLLKRIYSFINDMKQLLEGIDEDSFEAYKTNVGYQLGWSKTSVWNEIVSNRYKFHRHIKENFELELIEKEDLIEWYNKYIRSPNCRRLSVCIWGCKTNRKKNTERYVKIFKQLRMSSTKLDKTFRKKKTKRKAVISL